MLRNTIIIMGLQAPTVGWAKVPSTKDVPLSSTERAYVLHRTR